MEEFACIECDSRRLAYQKYVKHVTPVFQDENGNCEYLPPRIDEDDFAGTGYGFVCWDCGHPLEHAGCWIQTEEELRDYLNMDMWLRIHEENLYEDRIALEEWDQQLHDWEQIEIAKTLVQEKRAAEKLEEPEQLLFPQ